MSDISNDLKFNSCCINFQFHIEITGAGGKITPRNIQNCNGLLNESFKSVAMKQLSSTTRNLGLYLEVLLRGDQQKKVVFHYSGFIWG